jgi:hypothetical protein
MAETGFTEEQLKTMLRGIHDRRDRWMDLNPAVEIVSMGEQVGLNRNESYDLFKHLLDEDLISTRFLRAGNDPSLGQEVGQRHLIWDGKEVRLGHDLKLTTTGRSIAGVE